eukprot:934631-Pyramimonas_sp.AAC.1
MQDGVRGQLARRRHILPEAYTSSRGTPAPFCVPASGGDCGNFVTLPPSYASAPLLFFRKLEGHVSC